MCPDLWITSSLFDLIMNLLMGASLLALAKSIYYYHYYYLLTNMELLIRETVGQELIMKASFRDVNEALQRSITVLQSKKMGIFYSQNDQE